MFLIKIRTSQTSNLQCDLVLVQIIKYNVRSEKGLELKFEKKLILRIRYLMNTVIIRYLIKIIWFVVYTFIIRSKLKDLLSYFACDCKNIQK